MEGKGIFYYNNGNKYDGEYKNNKNEGKGTFYYNDDDIYDGEWKNNKINGKGIFIGKMEIFMMDNFKFIIFLKYHS